MQNKFKLPKWQCKKFILSKIAKNDELQQCQKQTWQTNIKMSEPRHAEMRILRNCQKMKMSFKLIKFCLKIIFCKRIILKPMKFHSFYIRLINRRAR